MPEGYEHNNLSDAQIEDCKKMWMQDGGHVVWRIRLRNRKAVTVLARVVDVRPLFGRCDLLIQTNTGDRAWVSDAHCRKLPAEQAD